MKKRWLAGLAFFSVLPLVGVLAASWWALQRTRVVPDFYQRASSRLPQDLDQTIRSLQHDVSQLQGDADCLGGWNATFTDSQVNAWLVRQLPEEFPNLLPQGVSDPRIVIDDGVVLAAAKYKNHRIDTVVSFEIRVALTEHANVLAVRIKNLRAGTLPLPLSNFLRAISREAAKSDLEVRWDMDHAGPVALVTVPSEHPEFINSPVVVESVELADGLLLLAGNTGSEAREAYTPQGPVYQLASNRSRRGSSAGRNSIDQQFVPALTE